MDANPFIAPRSDSVEREPLQTTSSLWGMASSFEVGGSTVTVQTGHWSGVETYLVDGEPVREVRNLAWHHTEELDVAGHHVTVASRWYPFLPVQVRVDGNVYLRDLFPQLRVVKLALAIVVLPLFLILTAGIVHDLVGIWLLLT